MASLVLLMHELQLRYSFIALNEHGEFYRERDSIHYEFVVPPAVRLSRIDKAWYQRIFNPVTYCQYLVHILEHNDVPDSYAFALQRRSIFF